MAQFQAVIFDFNGVMVDDFEFQMRIWSDIWMKVKHESLLQEKFIQILGSPAKDIIRDLIEPGASDARVSEIQAEIVQTTKDQILKDPTYTLTAGLPKFLTELKEKNVPITIATSLDRYILAFIFDRLTLEKWFTIDRIVYQDGSYPGKPAPDAYIRAAKLLNTNPKDCVVFEDAVSGLKSAYAAGIGTIIAVGTVERLNSVLLREPGVSRGIGDFTEISLSDLK